MMHDWILSVLADLRDYARANGLPDVAGKADEALRAAQSELTEKRRISGPGEAMRYDNARS